MTNTREVQAMTNRIRRALRLLPNDVANPRPTGDPMMLVRDDLQEIIGAATAIADLLDIEL